MVRKSRENVQLGVVFVVVCLFLCLVRIQTNISITAVAPQSRGCGGAYYHRGVYHWFFGDFLLEELLEELYTSGNKSRKIHCRAMGLSADIQIH